jgi:hypothetical protein
MSIMIKPCQTQLNNKHPFERRKRGKKERTIIQPRDNTFKSANAPMKGIKKNNRNPQRIPSFFLTPKGGQNNNLKLKTFTNYVKHGQIVRWVRN